VAEAYKFFVDNELSDSWKYEAYCVDYVELYIYLSGLELIKSGEYSEEDVVASFYIELEEGVEIASEYESAKNRMQKLENEILTVTPDEYYKQYILYYKAEATTKEEAYNDAKAKYDSAPNNEKYESEYVRAKAELDTAKITLRCWELISEKSAAPTGWQHTIVAVDLPETIANYLLNVPVSRSEYMGMYSDMYGTYEAYVKDCESGLKHYNGIMSKYVFAIENDIEIRSEYYPSSDVSAKAATRNQVESFISIFTIIMIIMLAGSIAKEFSRGTVRLLLIRPRTRTQIIVSKLLAILIIFAVLTVGILLVTSLEYMLILGFDDMFVPDVLIIGESIVAIPSFIVTVIVILVAVLPALAYASIASLLAALSKKTGMSITLPVLLNVLLLGIVVSIASVLVNIRPGLFSWIEYSPIVYFDMSFIDPNAFGGAFYSGIWLGVVYHIIFIALMTWLTIFAYKKSEVKG